MLGPWLANESAHVHEARRNDVAPAVDNPRLSWQLGPRNLSPDAGDEAIDDNETAARLGLLNGIDQTRIDESDRRSGRHEARRDYRGAPASASGHTVPAADIQLPFALACLAKSG